MMLIGHGGEGYGLAVGGLEVSGSINGSSLGGGLEGILFFFEDGLDFTIFGGDKINRGLTGAKAVTIAIPFF